MAEPKGAAPGKYVLLTEAQRDAAALGSHSKIAQAVLAAAIPLEALVVPENCVLVFSGCDLTYEKIYELREALRDILTKTPAIYLPQGNLKALSLEDCRMLRDYLDARMKEISSE